MKALTLKQPWASLMAHGLKRNETRSWSTRHRGLVAIHAAKGFPRECQELHFLSRDRAAFRAAYCKMIGGMYPEDVWLNRLKESCGKVIAVGLLVNCRVARSSHEKPFDENEVAFGDYTPGRYVWEFKHIQMLPFPISARGALSLWEWDPGGEVAQSIMSRHMAACAADAKLNNEEPSIKHQEHFI